MLHSADAWYNPLLSISLTFNLIILAGCRLHVFLLGELQILVCGKPSQIIYSHRYRQKVTLISCICTAFPLSLFFPLLSFSLCLSSFPPEYSFSQAYFPWAFADCVIAITPCRYHGNRWSVYCLWVQICHIWWHKQNEGFECVSVCVCACALNSSDLYLWIKATCVRKRFIYPVKLYEQYCIQKMRNHNRFCTLTCQFIRIPSNLVSGLSVNGGFMRSVCLHSSVSSTKPPWGVEDTLAGVILVNQNNLFWQTRRDVWQWGVNFHWKSRLNGSRALFHPMFYIYLNSISSWNSFVNLTNRLHSMRDLMTHFMTHRIMPVHLRHSVQCTPTSITHTGS